MSREIVSVTIDGELYEITKMDPFKSLRLFTRLVKIVGPAAGAIFGDEKTKELDIMSADFGKVLGELADRLSEDQMEATARELLAVVLKKGKKVEPILDFGGNVPLMMQVMAEVLQAEYGGFLELFSSLGSKFEEAKAS